MKINHSLGLYKRIDSHNLTYKVIVDYAWLWHLIYGNLNFKSLYTLKLRKMVHDFPRIRRHVGVQKNWLIGKK